MKDYLYKIYGYICYLYRKLFNKYLNIEIIEDNDAIDLIVKERLSLSRFGDGEFGLIINNSKIGFQDSSELLNEKLRKVLLENKNPKLLLGVPRVFVSDKDYNLKTKVFWATFVVKRYKILHSSLMGREFYINASLTRPYMDYKEKKSANERFENIKKLWNERDVIIVEGENTFFGVGNDLLNNATKIRRIICPSKNAFKKYDLIYETINNYVNNNTLVLLALGPTATVLASDLSSKGYQALDIGHIDIEYEWYKKNAKNKVKVQGKSTNEVNGEDVVYLENKKYSMEVICKVI